MPITPVRLALYSVLINGFSVIVAFISAFILSVGLGYLLEYQMISDANTKNLRNFLNVILICAGTSAIAVFLLTLYHSLGWLLRKLEKTSHIHFIYNNASHPFKGSALFKLILGFWWRYIVISLGVFIIILFAGYEYYTHKSTELNYVFSLIWAINSFIAFIWLYTRPLGKGKIQFPASAIKA